MAQKMKAILKSRSEPGFTYTQTDIPALGPRDVLIEVKAAAICGSDLNAYQWTPWAQKVFINIPFIPGHECAGAIADVGSEVTLVKPGDKVAAETHIPCGTCYQCKNGSRHICQNMKLFGHTCDGCFAEFGIIPETAVRKIPESICWEHAAILEPVGVSIRPAIEAGVFGETVVVLGCGAIGQIAVASAKIGGASKIIAADINDQRLALAKIMGADIIVNAVKENLTDVIRKATQNNGIDHVIEASGNADALEESFGYLIKGGKVSILGNPKRPVQLDIMPSIIHKEAKVTGYHGRRMYDTWGKAEALITSGKLNLDPLITYKFGLKDFEKAFGIAVAGQGCKVLLIP